MKSGETDSIYDYLTPEDTEACRAYRRAYATEYERLRDQETDEIALLRYWSELAHHNALPRLRAELGGVPVLSDKR